MFSVASSKRHIQVAQASFWNTGLQNLSLAVSSRLAVAGFVCGSTGALRAWKPLLECESTGRAGTGPAPQPPSCEKRVVRASRVLVCHVSLCVAARLGYMEPTCV